jgi:hypothetical protein
MGNTSQPRKLSPDRTARPFRLRDRVDEPSRENPGGQSTSNAPGGSAGGPGSQGRHTARGRKPRIPVEPGQAASASASLISRLRCLVSKVKWPPLTVTRCALGMPRCSSKAKAKGVM